MANAATKLANVNGYTTAMGNRGVGAIVLSWDTGNYPAGGLTLGRQSFGLRGFDAGFAGVTAGGNYIALVQNPGRPGSATLRVRLIVLATGVEVGTGVALTADSVVVVAVGG